MFLNCQSRAWRNKVALVAVVLRSEMRAFLLAVQVSELDGKRYLWKTILKLRQEQCQAAVQQTQPSLFPLKEDSRPKSQRDPSKRYEEPNLF